MGLDNLHQEMKVFLMKTTSTSIAIGTTFITYPFFIFEVAIGKVSFRCHMDHVHVLSSFDYHCFAHGINIRQS
jgi:hypothetical protein